MNSDDSLTLRALDRTRFATYWLDSLGPDNLEASLKQDTRCDLLVVGGGFCGLWGAIQAKEQNADRDVVLIEAKSVATGASGRPGAIMSTSVMHGIDNTERMFPSEVSELEQLGRENMDAFKQAIERYNIDCDIEWGGEMKVSIGDQGLDTIEEDYELYKKYGHEAIKLDKQGIRSEINSPIFHAAVWSKKRSGTINPGKLVRGLKRVALELGVKMFEFTPLLSSHDKGKTVEVKTPHANITANRVLLATNAWAAGHKRISSRVTAIRDRILVTEPLSEAQIAQVGWANRQGIYDTRTQLNYMRLTKDNRILFGGRLGYFYGNNTDPTHDKTPAPYVRLVHSFYRTFPQLREDIRFSHAWSGPIGLTTRMAVHYQKYFGGKMVFAGGYSGFGVTASRFGARVGLALLDGDDIPETRMAFAKTMPGYIPPEPFRWIGALITMYALDTLDEKGGWRKLWVKLVEKMGFPITL
ncbi:MAG: glycine/D-amino acid oxidase-like deaminating enzyme [Parasphingorhabdus sp.]|jgi:glycine/D-amino acid oxidase-like deaminating enzyme